MFLQHLEVSFRNRFPGTSQMMYIFDFFDHVFEVDLIKGGGPHPGPPRVYAYFSVCSK